MADESNEAGGKRRRPPTIDLKATEVASGPVHSSEPLEKSVENPNAVAAASASGAAEPSPATASESKADPQPATKPEAKPDWLGTAPWNERLSSMRRDFSQAFDWRLLGAGVAGAAVMFALFLAAYAGGAFTPRDTTAPLLAQLGSVEKKVRDLESRPQPAPPDPRPFADLTDRVAAAE